MEKRTLRPRKEIPRLGMRGHVPLQLYIVLYFPSAPSGLRQQQMLLSNQHISSCVMGIAEKLEGNMTIVKYDAMGIVTVRETRGRRLHTSSFRGLNIVNKTFKDEEENGCGKILSNVFARIRG